VKLTIGNARTTVDGLVHERKWLADLLTVDTKKPDLKRGGTVKHYFYKLSDTTFPSGLMEYVLRAQCPNDVHLDLVNKKTRLQMPATPIWLDGFEERDYQIKAVKLMLDNHRGLIHAATNSGKSGVATSYLKTVQPMGFRGIVLIHRKELFEQLLKTFREHLPKKTIGALGQGQDDVAGRQFVVAMYQTMRNRIGDDPSVTKLYKEHQLIMLDEVHHLTAAGLQEIFVNSDAPLRFGFSGTVPDPHTYAGMQVRAHTGKVLIRISNAELIDRGVSAVPDVHYITRDWKSLFKGFYNRFVEHFSMRHPDYLPMFRSGGKWRSTFVKYRFSAEYSEACFNFGVVENDERNADIVKQVKKRDMQSLLIVERVEHGHRLIAAFDGSKDVAFIHGGSEDRSSALSKFKAGKLKTLISTQILDEGLDVSGIRMLVLAGVKKCKRALLQRVGRGLRRKEGDNTLLVLDYMDIGNKYLEKYSLDRRKVLKDEGFTIKEDVS
jgi:superfamily II DNA or RNA helicase